MFKSGMSKHQSIAAELSKKRKNKMMADGGQVTLASNDQTQSNKKKLGDMISYPQSASYAKGGMVGSAEEFDDNEDPMTPHKGHGAPRTMPDMVMKSEMDKEDPEDYNTTLNENRMNSYSRVSENEVENPNEMDEAGMFARALRRRAGMLMSVEEPEGYAEGGLVQPDHTPDMGNKPDEDMNGPTEEPMEVMPMRNSPPEHKVMDGLTQEAREALMKSKKARRYSSMR